MKDYEFLDIEALPGTDPDNAPGSTQHWVSSKRVQFYRGKPQSKGGFDALTFDDDSRVGTPTRLLYSQIFASKVWYIYGAFDKLFASTGTQLTNITPLKASTTSLASNPINVYFPTLPSDPVSVVSGSNEVEFTLLGNPVLQVGDSITIAGVSGAVGGIPATELNATHFVRSVSGNPTVTVSTSATSTTTGGGSSVTLASGVIRINQTAHTYVTGDRVKVLGATDTGGITAAEINVEHIIRSAVANSYTVLTTGTSTSAATGGGASVTVQGEIADGVRDANIGVGYSAGQYSAGQYSAALTSSSTLVKPRLWQADRYGNNALLTPGQQTGLYQWTGSTATAPTLVTNAPTTIDGFFVFKNIVVTYDGSLLKWNDAGNLTVWTPTAQNYAGQDDIEGADDFISHAATRDYVLLFTNNRVYVLTFIDLPLVFDLDEQEVSDGIIAQNARYAINGVVYWMGNSNFYMYAGGGVKIMPNNTVLQEVLNNLNQDQKSKVYCEYRRRYNTLYWIIPWGGSTDPNRRVACNVTTYEWWIDDDDEVRTASEYPLQLGEYLLTSDEQGFIFREDTGLDAGDDPLGWELESPWFNPYGKYATEIQGVVPESVQVGNLQMRITGRDYLQSSTKEQVITRTISATDDFIDFQMSKRFFKVELFQNATGESWRMGRLSLVASKGSEIQ